MANGIRTSSWSVHLRTGSYPPAPKLTGTLYQERVPVALLNPGASTVKLPGRRAMDAIQQVEKMRAGAIKEELTRLSISYADCFEKQELVMRLANARVKNYSSQKKTMSTSSREFKTLARMPLTKLKSTATSPKNYILVPLKINDEGPFNFILDTGSTVTLIRPSIVTDILKLTPKAARVSMALMGGGISNQNNMTINLKDVKIGDHALCNVSALLMDEQMLRGWEASADGLLGLNILSQFDVEFDFSNGVLVFYPPGAASRGECDMQDMEKLSTSEVTLGILGVKVALGGAPPELALLDLGSSLCVASPDIAKLAGVSESVLQGRAPALGGGGMGQPGAMRFVSGLIDVGMVSATSDDEAASSPAFTIKGAQFAIGDVPALRAVGCRILLGLNVFQGSKLMFCQSTKSVYQQRSNK
ncbi:hypothetical protein AXG93_4605s1240 [Marchantia polymorpha subsp. ruderalis]|uniref:Peptidase A2 domain-containing protein n=1 Tax=Marchantia polymorpha subsp. ruderalis TaxID=1480154 RepID=A0A176WMI3_MARPO|nr:hypothetical protein AXG93_4605s1240 [Marchantia polymorpha subsp. ruderalis]